MSKIEVPDNGLVDLQTVRDFLSIINKIPHEDREVFLSSEFLNFTKIWDYKGSSWFNNPGTECVDHRHLPQYKNLQPFSFVDTYIGLDGELNYIKRQDNKSPFYPVPSYHTLINKTDLLVERVKKSSVKTLRWLFIDLDIQIDDKTFTHLRQTFKPYMVINSSPGKYHFYWPIKNLYLDYTTGTGAELARAWELAMKVLAVGFCLEAGHPAEAADLSSCTLGRMMRIPGISRVKLSKTGEEYFMMPSFEYVAEGLIKNFEINFRGLKDLGDIFGTKALKAWASALEVEQAKLKISNTRLDTNIKSLKALAVDPTVSKMEMVHLKEIAKLYEGRAAGNGGREPYLYQFLCKVALEFPEMNAEELVEIAVAADRKNSPSLFQAGGGEFTLEDMDNRAERAIAYRDWVNSSEGEAVSVKRKEAFVEAVKENKKKEGLHLLKETKLSIPIMDIAGDGDPESRPATREGTKEVGADEEVRESRSFTSYEGMSKAEIKERKDFEQEQGLQLLEKYLEFEVLSAGVDAFSEANRRERLAGIIGNSLLDIQIELGESWPVVEGLSSKVVRLESNKKTNIPETSNLLLDTIRLNGFWNESGIVFPTWKSAEVGNRTVCAPFNLTSSPSLAFAVKQYLIGFTRRVRRVIAEQEIYLPYGWSIGNDTYNSLADSVVTNVVTYKESLGGETTPFQDPNIIVFQNGVFHLLENKFEEDKLAPILYPYAVAVDYVEANLAEQNGHGDIRYKGSAPMFEDGVENLSQDPATRDILKLLPAWVAGTNGEAKSFILLNGPKDTGKSAYASFLSYGLGGDRMTTLEAATLGRSGFLGGFIGLSRLVFVSELSAGAFGGSSGGYGGLSGIGGGYGGGYGVSPKFSGSSSASINPSVINLIKTLSGNEKIKLDVKGGQPLSVKQAPKLIFATNEDFTPGGSGTDWESIERRLVPLTFHVIPEERRVDDWAKTLACTDKELDKAFSLSCRLLSRWLVGEGPEVKGPEVKGPEVKGPEVKGPEVKGPDVENTRGRYANLFLHLKSKSEVIQARMNVMKDLADPVTAVFNRVFEFAENYEQLMEDQFKMSVADIVEAMNDGFEDADSGRRFNPEQAGLQLKDLMTSKFPQYKLTELKGRTENYRFWRGLKLRNQELPSLKGREGAETKHRASKFSNLLGSIPAVDSYGTRAEKEGEKEAEKGPNSVRKSKLLLL